MDYKIAIPSYKRSETIKNKTLKLLNDYGIDKKRITIFVANKEEETIYKNSLQDEYKIVVGVPTIGKQRNYIEKYYEEDVLLMMFDDDLDGIYRKNKKKLDAVDDLEEEFIFKGFNYCLKYNVNIFGLYAAANPFFMKRKIYTKLCYIPGGVFGIKVKHDPFLERVTNHGEDYEYSIRQYIKNKALIRFDYLTIKSKFFKEEGGLQTIRTKKYIYDSIYQIQSMFPQYCKMYIRKSTGNAELRLKDTR